MSRTVLITGATSGIGQACAEAFAKEGYSLLIGGRREERLHTLATDLEEYGVQVSSLVFDVQNRTEVEAALADVGPVDILINNAGLALGTDHLHKGDIDNWEQMIDTNLKGLLYVSRMIIPGMVERKQGHIFNVGSIAGREVYPGGNVYCATKHAVYALSKAMRIELAPHNIRVTDVEPGAVNTEFSTVRFAGDKQKADQVYQGFDPLLAEDIARAIVFTAQ